MSSKSLNHVLLIGNITRDPELRYTPQGNAVCTFGLATNRTWKTESGEIREEAEFHRLVAWNKLAELCSQLCTKGRKIYVEGRLQTRTFTGSDNLPHTITEIVIDDMILLDSKLPGTTTQPVAPVVTPEEPKVEEESKPVKKTKKSEEKVEEKKAEEAPKSEEVNLDDIPF